MKKSFCMTALLMTAFFILPFFCLTARAEPVEVETDGETIVEELPVVEHPVPIEITIINETPVTDNPETPPRPFTPAGTGLVVDNATDSDGKEFYTITTPDEHIFYLVIDRQRNTENVYFLNAVTVADLLALAEIPAPPQSAAFTPPPVSTTQELPEEAPPAHEQTDGNNMGMLIFIGVIVVLGGGAGWYFKIYRPKQQGGAKCDEYEPHISEGENDYYVWDDDQDDIQDDTDDGPPWDDDESGGEE